MSTARARFRQKNLLRKKTVRDTVNDWVYEVTVVCRCIELETPVQSGYLRPMLLPWRKP
jgi:hypothetical protein